MRRRNEKGLRVQAFGVFSFLGLGYFLLFVSASRVRVRRVRVVGSGIVVGAAVRLFLTENRSLRLV